VLSAPVLEEAGGQVGNLDMVGLREMEAWRELASDDVWIGWCWWRDAIAGEASTFDIFGRGGCSFEDARSDLLPGSHHWRVRRV
jgi:hypothetical protein